MIYIIDFGSQTTHLIGRRISSMGIPVKIIPLSKCKKVLTKEKPSGIILSGGPRSVYDSSSIDVEKDIFKLDVPILGICYGLHQIAKHLGGKVSAGEKKEFGPATLEILKSSKIVKGIGKNPKVWMSHGDEVSTLPKGFEVIARTRDVSIAAIANESRRIYGVQFHPEVSHTECGESILKNFLNICGLEAKGNQLEISSLVEKLRREMPKGRAICAVSGGVDSTVAAVLCAEAIGECLVPVYIESGLMRVGTRELVEDIFKNYVGLKVHVIRAKGRFLKALKGITNPEKKRKIIGKLYVDLFEEEAKKLEDVKYLIQGTIYSDVIESKGSKNAVVIKSHHNVGGLPKEIDFHVVEPFREMYKDEVRLVGTKLNLPEEIVFAQPFPGPGQAIRIIGEVTDKRLKKQQKVDKIVVEEFKRFGLYERVFQCFPIMTGIKSTAVQGDRRKYAEVVAIRAYESLDVMTSNWAYLPRELLQALSSRIVNEVEDVSRVVYDITTKPPATMEWE
jgi:GMP synthase (glutamine-hydrolysing)